MRGWHFGVTATVNGQDGRHLRQRPVERRRRAQHVSRVTGRERRHRREIVEPAEAHDRSHTGWTIGGEQQRELCARVFANQRDVLRVYSELAGVTAHELHRCSHIVNSILRVCQAAEPIIDCEPVVAGAGQQLQPLTGKGGAASGVPASAVDDHDSRAACTAALKIRVHRERLTIDAAIHDVCPGRQARCSFHRRCRRQLAGTVRQRRGGRVSG